MTDQTTAVEQCDREALCEDIWQSIPKYMHKSIEKAFARHRTRALEATQSPETEAGELVKELWAVLYLHDWDDKREDGTQPIYPQVSRVFATMQEADADRSTKINPEKYWVRRAHLGTPLYTTPSRIEAAQAQGANQVYAVAVTMTKNMTKNMPNGLNIVTRLNTLSASSMDEAVGKAVADAQEANPEHGIFSIAKIAITPPQAAESGLLEEAVQLLTNIDRQVSFAKMGDWQIALDDIRRETRSFLAKAGKQGEGDREG